MTQNRYFIDEMCKIQETKIHRKHNNNNNNNNKINI